MLLCAAVFSHDNRRKQPLVLMVFALTNRTDDIPNSQVAAHAMAARNMVFVHEKAVFNGLAAGSYGNQLLPNVSPHVHATNSTSPLVSMSEVISEPMGEGVFGTKQPLDILIPGRRATQQGSPWRSDQVAVN